MNRGEILASVLLFWILFAMLLTLFYMFRRLSVRGKGKFYYWPPAVYRSYKRRLRRRYFKTLFLSVLAAFAIAGAWYVSAAPQ